MCSSKSNKLQGSTEVSHINGRPVLQPNCCNNIRSPSLLERRNSLKKSSAPIQVPPSPPSPPSPPKLKSPRHDPKCTNNLVNKKTNNDYSLALKNVNNISSSPGSIAAARREQVAIMQVQRKMRIAHYGRTKSAKYDTKIVPLDSSSSLTTANVKEERRCHFITSNSGINIYTYIY